MKSLSPKKQSLSKLKQSVQTLFNKKIRERDSKDGFFVCISCTRKLPIEKANAGHFFPVKGFNWLRYDEDNVNIECIHCNGFNKAHLIYYARNLQKKIGIERFEALILRSKTPKPEFTREELCLIKQNLTN